jgi:hypothetical protein
MRNFLTIVLFAVSLTALMLFLIEVATNMFLNV